MKKKIILLSFVLMILLSACKSEDTINPSANERYIDMVKQLQDRDVFITSSEYYDVSVDISVINGGYRYYVVIDNPKVAMYDIEAIAIEKDVDYSNVMAANIGLFEEEEYSMIPGQSYVEKGFVKGISISGVSSSENPTLYLLVSWHSRDLSITKKEYFKLNIKEENE